MAAEAVKGDAMPNTLAGMRIVTNDMLTETRYTDVPRTWRERLLGGYCPECRRSGWTMPWKPWVAKKAVAYRAPSSQVLKMGNTLVMHSGTLAAMLRAMDAGDGQTWPVTGETRAVAGGSGRTW